MTRNQAVGTCVPVCLHIHVHMHICIMYVQLLVSMKQNKMATAVKNCGDVCQSGLKSWNHRITEWPGLKRTTMIILFQLLCYEQGRQPLDQAAQRHTQLVLECLQGWGIYNLLGQPVSVLNHPLCEKLLTAQF